jgi:hypothetical protein
MGIQQELIFCFDLTLIVIGHKVKSIFRVKILCGCGKAQQVADSSVGCCVAHSVQHSSDLMLTGPRSKVFSGWGFFLRLSFAVVIRYKTEPVAIWLRFFVGAVKLSRVWPISAGCIVAQECVV